MRMGPRVRRFRSLTKYSMLYMRVACPQKCYPLGDSYNYNTARLTHMIAVIGSSDG